MIPRCTVIVRSGFGTVSYSASPDLVSVARMPWNPEVIEGDDRSETAPKARSIRNPNLDETCGPYAPARRVRR